MKTAALAGEPRYLFGTLDQETFGLTARVDFTVTPNLTIQYYAAPFVSAGSYAAFKRTTATHAAHYEDRFHTFGDDEIAYDATNNVYAVDEDVDGSVDYAIGKGTFLEGLVATFRYAWLHQDGSPQTQTQLRAILASSSHAQ